MNDQDQYRRMVLTTTQFEATLNHRGTKSLGNYNRNKYKTIYAQDPKPIRIFGSNINKGKFEPVKLRPQYHIDETEKWWK